MDPSRYKNKKKLKAQRIVFALSCTALIVLFINLLPEKFVELEKIIKTEEQSAYFYVFKNEDYRIIRSQTPIAFIKNEGEKAGADTLLSDNVGIDLSSYIKEQIDSVNYLLSDRSLTDYSDVNKQIQHTVTQLGVIDEQIKEISGKDDDAAKAVLVQKRSEQQEKLKTLKTALKFVNLKSTELKRKKKELEALLASGNIQLTPQNLNLSVYGYIYYSIDGYEDLMNIDKLSSVSSEYFSQIEKATGKVGADKDAYYIKSVGTDKIIIVAKVPADTYISAEYVSSAKAEELYTDYDISEGLYNFLYRRIDILSTYPTLSFTDKQGVSIETQLINIVYEDEIKFLVMCVRDNYPYFMEKRVFSANVIADEYSCFIIPKSAVFEIDEEKYVSAVNSSGITKNIKVNIYKTEGSKVILRTSQNSELQSYVKVFRKASGKLK